MASLKDAEQVTSQLDDLVGELRSQLAEGDFGRLMQLSDAISERADSLAEAFANMNDVLMSRLRELTGSGSRSSARTSSGTSSSRTSSSKGSGRGSSASRKSSSRRPQARKRSGSRR